MTIKIREIIIREHEFTLDELQEELAKDMKTNTVGYVHMPKGKRHRMAFAVLKRLLIRFRPSFGSEGLGPIGISIHTNGNRRFKYILMDHDRKFTAEKTFDILRKAMQDGTSELEVTQQEIESFH